MLSSSHLFLIAFLIFLFSCDPATDNQKKPLDDSSNSQSIESTVVKDEIDQLPDWYFCGSGDCYEGTDPTVFKKINEQPRPQADYVMDPMEVSPDFVVEKKYIFATGINKPGSEQWVVLERAIIGNDYIFSIFDGATNKKTVLFDKTNKTPQISYTPKPLTWIGDQLLIEDYRPDYARKHHGVWTLNPADGTMSQLNLMDKYLTSPAISADGRYLIYSGVSSSEDPDYLHGNANQLLSYDIQLNKETVIVQNESVLVFGWSKKKSKLTDTFSKKSVLPGFKLPWASGITRCCTRAGNIPPSGPIGSNSPCPTGFTPHGYIAHDFDTSNFSDEVITAVTGGTVILANYSSQAGGFSPNGYGNWVIVIHSNNYRTLYAHLSRVDVVVGQTITQGCVLGIEGTTGQSTGDHLHFEYETPGDINGNVYTTFDECNCEPHGEYRYTSANPVGTCGSSNLDCSNAIPITCGVTYAGSSSSATSNVTFYGCNNWTETGPERIHEVTATGSGTLTATLSNFSGDLDVYILGSCDPNDCLGTVSSSSATFTGAQIGQTYYIVVDADDGSGSAYNLLVTCPSSSLNCSNAIPLTCGVTYSGPSSSAASQVFGYGCNNWTESGPERIHRITPQGNGTLTATLSNFSGDLDVFILGSCDPADCLGTVSSSSATFTNAVAGTTYYIVVDADDGSGSSYNLVVDCPEPAGLDCSNAVSLTCGNNYFGLTSNAPSAVDAYGCNNWTETGPERVHTITPQADGTLTATLSNFTGDLDVYILGSCDPDDCLGTVLSSSAIYTNALAGTTYYIVVDADDGSGSSYNLFVDCPEPAGLDCNNAVNLTCGTTYFGPSSNALSAVDAYACNNWTETGPERVHTITPQTNGTLTATISNFTGDLDVYILGSCDPIDCLGTVTGSAATYTSALAGTTYYIVVDADDGSGSSYNLLVDCPPVVNNCPPNMSVTSPISSGVYEAYIQVNANAVQNNSTNVMFKGGSNVLLNGGFSVPAGAIFEASIEDCRN